MKRLLLGWIAVMGKAVVGVLVLSAAAVAAPTGKGDFNHLTTGFSLTGAHSVAVCETCHVGGVFKGTPRNCDGCHALGKRVVATPKSNSHIVTDAPCESCHFNTATFLGARYNHGTARPEQCTTCHNGRIEQGRPANHSSGKKVSDSCDHCHRTYAWYPASWNHIGVGPGTCTTCHNGSGAPGKPGSHTTVAKSTYQCDECHSFVGWIPARYKHNRPGTCASCHDGATAIGKPASHTPVSIKGMNQCDDCHSVTGWLPARFKHNTGAACSSCHNGTLATGKIVGHTATTDECNQCHTSTTTWLGALGGKPANHIPYNVGVSCSNCHTGLAKVNATTLHNNSVATYTCAICHITPNSYTGNNQKTRGSHEGSSGNNCTGCHEHSSAGSYGGW